MGVLSDFWSSLPKELKFIFAIAVFLYAGATILNVMVIIWNLLGVNAANAINGCFGGNAAACVPQQEGIFIFGINFADYWTITFIVIMVPIAMFALKWYGFMLGNARK